MPAKIAVHSCNVYNAEWLEIRSAVRNSIKTRAISHRRILVEWLPEELENTYLGDYKLAGLGPAERDRSDPSYARG